MICRIVVSSILGSAYVNAFPCFLDTVLITLITDLIFRYFEELRQISVREAVELSLKENGFGRNSALMSLKALFFVYQFLHLCKEPALDLCKIVDLIDRSALTESFVDNELPLACRDGELKEQLFLSHIVEILGIT